MLVCNVSLRAPRRTIAVDLAEAAAADDAATTGSLILAALVDDNALAAELLDAYSGEIMAETATAVDTITAGANYTADILEDITARDTPDSHLPTVYVDSVIEAANATAMQDYVSSSKVRTFTASRAGLGSMTVTETSGKTQIISNIGAVI